MFREVPVLPVVVSLGVIVLAVLLLVLRQRRRTTWARVAVAVTVAVYAAGIVANTVFPIYLDMPTFDEPWGAHLNLVPLVDYESGDALMNVVVFVPIGMMASLVSQRASMLKVVLGVALISASIEITQLVTARLLAGGHIADVNDFLFNVVGGAMGYGFIRALAATRRGALIVDRFRWS